VALPRTDSSATKNARRVGPHKVFVAMTEAAEPVDPARSPSIEVRSSERPRDNVNYHTLRMDVFLSPTSPTNSPDSNPTATGPYAIRSARRPKRWFYAGYSWEANERLTLPILQAKLGS
jgi:hypothetical protein